jgi:transposase
MQKLYTYVLMDEERAELKAMLTRGKAAALKLTRARIILKAESAPSGPGLTDAAVAEALDVGHRTVERMRQRVCEDGPLAALLSRPSSRIYDRLLDGKAEAKLIALTCSEAPEGYGRWTLKLLAERMVTLEYVPHLSYEAVRQTLKKTSLSPGSLNNGV